MTGQTPLPSRGPANEAFIRPANIVTEGRLTNEAFHWDRELFGHLMASYVIEELSAAIVDGDKDRCRLCFDYLEAYRILPGRGPLADLGQMIRSGNNDRELALRLRRAIQAAPEP